MIPELKRRMEDLGEDLITLGQSVAGLYGFKEQPTLKKIIEAAARASVYFGEDLQIDDVDFVFNEIQSRRPEVTENENPDDISDFINICVRDECLWAEKTLGLRYLSDKALDAAYLESLGQKDIKEQDKIFNEIKRRMEKNNGDMTKYFFAKVFRKQMLEALMKNDKSKYDGKTADEYFSEKWRGKTNETV